MASTTATPGVKVFTPYAMPRHRYSDERKPNESGALAHITTAHALALRGRIAPIVDETREEASPTSGAFSP
jgi:hypothetical protein